MDSFERVRALRDEYEGALDEAEKLRAAYHREVVKLHRSGTSLREIAEHLGVSHQRVHQIVGTQEPMQKRRRPGGAAAVVGMLLLASIGAYGAHRFGSGSSPTTSPTASNPAARTGSSE